MPVGIPSPFTGDLPLNSAKWVVPYGSSQVGVNFEPYVVPAGRKAIWVAHAYHNATGSTGTSATRIKRADGTYRDIQPVVNLNSGGGVSSNPVVLSAGERPVFAAPTLAGVQLHMRLLEFDDTPFLLRADADLVSGDNILYTVPGGYSALLLSATAPPSVGFAGTTFLIVSNVSGATRAYQAHIFPPGTTASSTATRQSNSGSGANNTLLTISNSGARNFLSAGEKLVINSDGGAAGQWGWVNLFLVPA